MKLNTSLVIASLAVGSSTTYEEKFEAWMKGHGMDFHPMEWIRRFENFIVNDQFIESHNQAGSSFTLGHNMYSHLSYNEFKKMSSGLRVPKNYIEERLQKSLSLKKSSLNVNVPDEIDWEAKGGVTSVKNQGMCGSCWAFSTTGAIEGAAYVASNKLVSLSEQELVDCDDNDNGCQGGLMDNAFKWIEHHKGLCREEDYTYHANASSCAVSKCKPATKVTGFVDVAANDEDELKIAVAQQPVSVAIQADQREFQFYKSGVFDKPCGTQLDHGVLVVGYGTKEGKKYWKVKNSWGQKWGDAGYIYLARDLGPDEGQCGLAMVPSYPKATVIADEVEPVEVQETIEEKKLDLQVTSINVGEGVTIVQCGDLQSQLATFSNLTVTPKNPKRGKPIHFFGDGVLKSKFDTAHLNIAVKLADQLVYSHFGSVCGKSHIPLPLGLGHIDVIGLKCPAPVGKFDQFQVALKLPKIAPEGNYEVYLTSEIGEGNKKQTVFCVQVKLDLGDDEDAGNGEVYELLALS